MTQKRIVSLLPAATEIVCALGLQENLVGRSHECDFPDAIQGLPICSSSKIPSNLTSQEIDQQVKQALTDVISLYTVDVPKIQALDADIIITQAQCEVCAVSLSDVEKSLKDSLNSEIELISLNPTSVDEILNSILELGRKLGVADRAEQLVDELRERCDLITHKLKFVSQRPSLVCVEWIFPLMTAGNWTPELIEIAGGLPLLTEKQKHSAYISFEQLKAADPDILVIAPCGFTLDRTLHEIGLLLELPGWSELAAVKNNNVFIADGNQYFNRSSPRVVDTAELLAEIIHPKQFIFGYEGKGWLKFST